jgi:hypothetical protein
LRAEDQHLPAHLKEGYGATVTSASAESAPVTAVKPASAQKQVTGQPEAIAA